MKLIISVVLLFFYLNAIGQVGPLRNWVDSEVKYTVFKGNTLTITNSLPKGGGVVDKNGEKIGYRVFWTRIRNNNIAPINLKLKFPGVKFIKSNEFPIKLVLPKDQLREEKIQLFDYGLTNIKTLLTDESNRLNRTQKTIGPQEDYYFYVVAFIQERGLARSALILKGKQLYYKLTIDNDSIMVPCGSLFQ